MQIGAMYLPVKVLGQDITCLIDTGSTLTVLHPRKYEALPDQEKPARVDGLESGSLRMADGHLMPHQGIVTLPLTLADGFVVEHPVVLADIDVPLILGFDFLQRHQGVLDTVGGTLSVKGTTLQCIPENTMPSVFRIGLLRTVVVPPESEIIVPGQVLGTPAYTQAVIEPMSSFISRQPDILIGRVLADPSAGCVPLRVMNLSSQPVRMHSKTHAATCWPAV